MAFTEWLHYWQELVGAGLTSIVGVVAIFVARDALTASRDQIEAAREQIKLASDHEERRLRRRELAARVVLPLVLSGTCAWVKAALDSLRAVVVDGRVDEVRRLGFKPPPPPTDHIASLQRMIESTDDQAVIERISSLIGTLQMFHARLAMFSDADLRTDFGNLISLMANGCVVYAVASSMFTYARGQHDSLPHELNWGHVEGAVDSLNIYGIYIGPLQAYLGNCKAMGNEVGDVNTF